MINEVFNELPKLRVSITQEDISKGDRRVGKSTPVVKAIRRTYGGLNGVSILADTTSIRMTKKGEVREFSIPEVMKRWISRWHTGKNVKPINFLAKRTRE